MHTKPKKMEAVEPQTSVVSRSRSGERRQADRLHTVCRVGHVIAANDQGLARIRNISDWGLGLEVYMPVYLGDRLTIYLSEDLLVCGKVVWTNAPECGLQLDNEIDSRALLRELGAQATRTGSRALRIPLKKPAVVQSEAGSQLIDVRDVSQRGMKVAHDGSFREGLNVKILMASGLERQGVVRWSKGGLAGLMLLEPFCPSELGSIHSL